MNPYVRRFAVCSTLSICLSSLIAGCGSPPRQDLSVVLISPDSLRTDRLRPWNPEAPAVPNVEALAARGTMYRNAWSTAPWTAPSMVSVMTGLYPPSHGVAYRDDTTPSALPTLPRALAERGYEIGNFSFFSQISYFRNLGLGKAEKGLSHARVAGSFRNWLENLDSDQRFFAWVHLLETHLPYGASGYRATEITIPGSSGLEESQINAVVPIHQGFEFEKGDREPLLELYDRDVMEMDRVLGQVLAALEAQGRLDSTLIVFVADHGEELLEHGWVGHASTAVEARLVPEILHVPLILVGPGIPAGKVSDELVQHVDILPSVMRLLGLETPSPNDGTVLPGLGLTRSWWPWGRRLAFFDSSPGGNLTPQDKRGERLQGVTDGRCLISSYTTPDSEEATESMATDGGECSAETIQELQHELADWQKQQTRQRLEVLASYPEGSAPPSDEVDGYEEKIAVTHPQVGEQLSFRASGGQVKFAWQGSGKTFWIEYLLGSRPAQIRGSFQVVGQQVVFGPVPEGFWNDVASYSPSRIRIVDAESQQRSPWIDFEVLPVG